MAQKAERSTPLFAMLDSDRCSVYPARSVIAVSKPAFGHFRE
jgi:hypothetical protein